MALRLIEIILPDIKVKDLREILKEHNVIEHGSLRLLNGDVLVRVLLDAKQDEAILDVLERYHPIAENNRVVILPVEATLPRAMDVSMPEKGQKTPVWVSREELYEDIKDSSRCSWIYLVMIVLSTIVAAVGLHNNSVAMIIGAMVIAPMLRPSMASALGAVLGDLSMLWRALLTGLAGILTAMIFSVLIGVLVHVDPTMPEVMSRITVRWGDILVAMASGCAGALAFTRGAPSALIGVMVAVALLPPLVTSGLLLGSGYPSFALGALSLFLINFICVNISAVAVFAIQGIHPGRWYEKDRANKATLIAILLWVTMLIVLCALVVSLK